jgi:adenylylsulfate kinase
MRRKILIMGLPVQETQHWHAPSLPDLTQSTLTPTRSVARSMPTSDSPNLTGSNMRVAWVGCAIRSSEPVVLRFADFICPAEETRAAFTRGGSAFIIWVDRVSAGRFEDTNRMFASPAQFDLRVSAEGNPDYWAEQIANRVRPIFDPKRPTAIFIGRDQPFHDGHKALITEGLRRVGQVCVAVRDTGGIDEKNPFSFDYVRARIEHALREFEGSYAVVPLPNVTHVLYGRDVGYTKDRAGRFIKSDFCN